eukprot:scaffold50845_cov20-Prasinocladus_malaysianus.AAC.1
MYIVAIPIARSAVSATITAFRPHSGGAELLCCLAGHTGTNKSAGAEAGALPALMRSARDGSYSYSSTSSQAVGWTPSLRVRIRGRKVV